MKKLLLSGGFGNQIFQYLGYIKYLDSNGYRRSNGIIDISLLNPFLPMHIKRNLELDKLIEIEMKLNQKKLITELEYLFFKKISLIKKHTPFIFNSYQDINLIDINDLKLKKDVEKKIIEKSNYYKNNNINVVMHLRFGDYLDNKKTSSIHGVLKPEYYLKSLNNLKNKTEYKKILVISDDPINARLAISKIKQSIVAEFLIVNSNYMLDDFIVLCSIQNKIIANSSFSYWAAMIGDVLMPCSNNVIYPKKWFVKDESPNIFPKHWKNI